MARFTIEDLTYCYPESEAPTLRNVSLDIPSGSYVLLCGKSGCGKTTLLRHLKTVLAPYGTTEGRVLFDGTPLDEVSEREQASRIGFVMQNPDAQIVTDKVWHELAFGLESIGCDQKTMRSRVAEMASYFGIQTWFHKDVRDLSGGQKQLMNLASIMAMHPDVLILDEPTAQLDPLTASDFLNTVRKINVELGTTVIITEHRIEEIYSVADKVVVMDDGRVMLEGHPLDVGKSLHDRRDDMILALPSPMRIYYGVMASSEGGSVNADMARKCPLTVREGRTWIEGIFADNPPHDHIVPDRAADCGDEDPVMEFSEVWFRYERDLPDVLRDLSFAVPRGSFYAIVGGNGVGKSTTLKVATGAAKAYRGTVKILGKKLKGWNHTELFRGGLAMLPQDPQNLFVKKTVRADLEEMLDDRGLSKEEREARVLDVAKTCGVAHLLDSHPFDLSGGEQQRAALAKVLLCEPQILLLDEPTKGIDAFFKAHLAQVFNDLRQQGITIVMVSHDVEFCARYATHVSMFFDGSIVTTNTPQAFFSSNSFYTTAASRISREFFMNTVTDEEVIELCAKNL